jgi:Uma2 family endonuclease
MVAPTAARTITLPRSLPTGEIVAVDVSEAEYMEQYAEAHHEWVRGVVVKMSPISLNHAELVDYLKNLLQAYFSLHPIGKVLGEPFVLRLEAAGSRREPDLQVILQDNLANLKDTYMDGPADLCIEVVSPGSVAVDYGERLAEYEKGGVGEYWIIDPVRRACHFHRLTGEGVYQHHSAGEDGLYTTSRLSGFTLDVPTLWQPELPDYGAVWQMVQAMLKDTGS